MKDTAELFIDSRCELGEGIFWHPLVERVFWFDILNKTLFSATAGGIMVDRFTFEATVTAAGVIDGNNLAIASAAGIFRLNLSTDSRELLVPLEPDSTTTRSNDGRVGPSGAFWIGTMGLKDPGKVAAGALYSVRDGAVTKLLSDIHIPNATCFSPDGGTAYFTDGVTRTIRKVSIDKNTGLPNGPWQDFAKVSAPAEPDGVTRTIRKVSIDKNTGLPNGPWQDFAKVSAPAEPDGAVVDSAGYIWNAQWAAGTVIRFAPDGSVDRVVKVPVSRPTCPAFGGKDLRTLYISSAREGLSPEQLDLEPLAGGVFAIEVDVPGLPENIVKI